VAFFVDVIIIAAIARTLKGFPLCSFVSSVVKGFDLLQFRKILLTKLFLPLHILYSVRLRRP
jgi:hypothetical protein